MDHMTMLWEYQVEDIKADRLAHEIRRNPLRQKMENDRALYMERQKQHKQIEEQVAVLADRKDAIRDALRRCQEQLGSLQSRYEATPPTELESIRSLITEVNRCLETISGYESEMRRIAGEVREHDQRANVIRTEGARLRNEFEQLKAQYDKAIPPKKAALDAQRAVAEEKKAGIPEELLQHYIEVKKHITPPLARLIGDQCSGCNTSLPSAVLHSVRNASDNLVKCVSCGRIIIKL